MADLDLLELLDDELYHQDTSHISSTGLKYLARTPAHHWERYRNPKREPQVETDALRIGKAVHCCALEPEKFLERYVRLDDEINLRTKVAREYRDELLASGSVPLKAPEYDNVARMAAAMRRHPVWQAWMTGGHAEYLITWVDEETGVKCKMRADYLLTPGQGASIGLPNGLIPDLKTCRDARSFQRDAWNLGYHIQAAFYRRGYQAHFGTYAPPPFAFLAFEKEAPFAGIAYPSSPSFLEAGDREVSRLLRLYAECLASDAWPAYPADLVYLDPPAWAKVEMESDYE